MKNSNSYLSKKEYSLEPYIPPVIDLGELDVVFKPVYVLDYQGKHSLSLSWIKKYLTAPSKSVREQMFSILRTSLKQQIEDFNSLKKENPIDSNSIYVLNCKMRLYQNDYWW